MDQGVENLKIDVDYSDETISFVFGRNRLTTSPHFFLPVENSSANLMQLLPCDESALDSSSLRFSNRSPNVAGRYGLSMHTFFYVRASASGGSSNQDRPVNLSLDVELLQAALGGLSFPRADTTTPK